MGIKKTAKKIEPKNPDVTAAETGTDRDTDRKTAGLRWNGRKMGRKTSGFRGGV